MKRVHVVGKTFDHGLVKAMYYDRDSGWLYPDFCMVDTDGKALWQTNALRLRGPDVQAGERLGVVWGDSVVFCVFERGWPEMLNDFGADCTFLNGGIEGLDYIGVLQRAIDFNAKHDVAINVVMPGWHGVGENDRFAENLRSALREIPRAVLLTMPTALNARMIETDIGPLLRDAGGDDGAFRFWETTPYSIGLQKRLYAHVCERNGMIRDVAAATGTPLIDVFAALDSTELGDFREHFSDVSHLRPRAYPLVASAVWRGVEPCLRTIPAARTESAPPRTGARNPG